MGYEVGEQLRDNSVPKGNEMRTKCDFLVPDGSTAEMRTPRNSARRSYSEIIILPEAGQANLPMQKRVEVGYNF